MASLIKDRRAARRLALDVLYQAEIRDETPEETLSLVRDGDWRVISDDPGTAQRLSQGTIDYASALVEGVQQHAATIDARIEHHADRWTLERMPVVDRNILRIALFELGWIAGVPVAVVINEAVELAKMLSTETSGRFINGVLGKIAVTTGDAEGR